MNAPTPIPVPQPATIVHVEQGSSDWHRYRLSHRNASESAAVMELSPWITPYQLWLIKTGRWTAPVTQAMKRGTDLEPAARCAYEEQTGLIMQPLVLEAGAYSASLDGMTLEGDLVLEIKCPLRGCRSDLWQDALAGRVPDHYMIQIQHQLMVSGAGSAHLWVFDGTRGLLRAIDRDEATIGRIQSAWDEFQQWLDRDCPPPLSERDVVQRDDPEWTSAAQAYLVARREAELQTQRMEDARQALLSLASHPKEQGAGVIVTRYWKQGSVDYKKVPELRGIDLGPYRAKAREEVRISVVD